MPASRPSSDSRDAPVASPAPMNAVVTVYKSRELLWNLTLRELRTKYRRSFLGWAWSMLNPLSQILHLRLRVRHAVRGDSTVGRSERARQLRPLLLCGVAAVELLRLWSHRSGSARSRPTPVSCAASPSRREVLVFSNVLHACVQFSIEMTLLLIVLLIAGSPFLPWLPVVVLTSVLLAIFATGFALALSVLAVYFRDMSYLWAIVIQVWFFATPIVYPPSLLEAEAPSWVYNVLKLNPMNGFIERVSTLPLRRRCARLEDDGRPRRHIVRVPGHRLGDLPKVRQAAPGGGLNP